MLRTLVTILLCTMAISAAPTLDQMQKEQRVALVIANADYGSASLPRAVKTATAMRTFLERSGFEVLYGENVDKKNFISLLRDFSTKIHNGATALFYYYGHAIQNEGKNYLVPFEASVFDAGSIRYQTIELDTILDKLDKTPSRTYIAILETGFGNPFEANYKPDQPGLAPLKTHKRGSLFLAAQPYRVIPDSTLTSRFIKTMERKGMSLKQGKRHMEKTGSHAQMPLIRIDEANPFYFTLPDNLGRAHISPPTPERSFG